MILMENAAINYSSCSHRKEVGDVYYLESESKDPYYNLALEEFVFEHLQAHDSCLMLWQNHNTIVVGKYQNTAEEINQAYVDSHQISVARRLSGGGAVYHDTGNLNFTFITDAEELENFQFEVFVQPVIRVLEKMGVKAEFNGRNDVTIDGMKFSGNSQYMKHGRVMHHGCIMLNSNLDHVSQALKPKEAKFESKSVKSVKSRVTTINAHTDRAYAMEEFKALLKEEVFKEKTMKTWTLSRTAMEQVQLLRNDKYVKWDWNYGKSADYHMKYEKKFAAGLVTVYMNVEDGRIKKINLYGDFFGNGEIEELETQMTGLSLDAGLAKRLEPLQISHYMNGITAEDLAAMLRE